MWNIKFLNQTVVDEFETINCDLQARLLKLFELRAKAASGIARSIFCYHDGKTIIILLTYEKRAKRYLKIY